MKTRVVKLNNKYVAQKFKGLIYPFGTWHSYCSTRNGQFYINLEYVLHYCLHDTCSEAVETIDLMTITKLPE